MEPETMYAFDLVVIMEKARDSEVADGPIFEDSLVRVWKENGTVLVQGKPLRVPFIYSDIIKTGT